MFSNLSFVYCLLPILNIVTNILIYLFIKLLINKIEDLYDWGKCKGYIEK